MMATMNSSANLSARGLSAGAQLPMVSTSQEKVATILTHKANTGESKQYMTYVTEFDDLIQMNSSHLPASFIALSHCVSFISEESHAHLLKTALTRVDWRTADNTTMEAYLQFITALSATKATLTSQILSQVIRQFRLPRPSFIPEGEEMQLSDEDFQNYYFIAARAHNAIKRILEVVPSSTTTIHHLVLQFFPHARAHCIIEHKLYLESILDILSYCPSIRDRLLSIIVEKLVIIDASILPDEIPDDDDEADEDEMFFPVEIDSSTGKILGGALERYQQGTTMADKLDVMMALMFNYLENSIRRSKNSRDLEELDNIFTNLLRCFDSKIITTPQSKHVQFLLFYLTQANEKYAREFCQSLSMRLQDNRLPIMTRQLSASYLGSFISRASFLDKSFSRQGVGFLFDRIQQYMDNVTNTNADAETHALFYTICQAGFYAMCFLKEQFFTESSLEALRTDIDRIVKSNMNPLRYCSDAVAREFGRICESYGITSVSQVLKRNQNIALATKTRFGANNAVDSYFPFDPYILRRSSKYVNKIYRNWGDVDGQDDDDSDEDGGVVNNDDDEVSDAIEEAAGSFKSMSFTPVAHYLELHSPSLYRSSLEA